MQSHNVNQVFRALEKSWGLNSSSKWTARNPALGQCGVTALVVQDCLGGEIMKTWVVKPDVGELWHFYNLIDNKPIDFTISQFDEPIDYNNRPSNREEAFQDTKGQQYDYLSSTVRKHLQDA